MFSKSSRLARTLVPPFEKFFLAPTGTPGLGMGVVMSIWCEIYIYIFLTILEVNVMSHSALPVKVNAQTKKR